MQIILTQPEIEEAIRDSVLQRIAIKDDQSIAIVFEDDTDGNLIATIDTKKAAPVVEVEVKPKPEPGRSRYRWLPYANDNVVKACQWQSHPDIWHDEVKLGGEFSIFYPVFLEPRSGSAQTTQSHPRFTRRSKSTFWDWSDITSGPFPLMPTLYCGLESRITVFHK